jgi:hypothetical protein
MRCCHCGRRAERFSSCRFDSMESAIAVDSQSRFSAGPYATIGVGYWRDGAYVQAVCSGKQVRPAIPKADFPQLRTGKPNAPASVTDGPVSGQPWFASGHFDPAPGLVLLTEDSNPSNGGPEAPRTVSGESPDGCINWNPGIARFEFPTLLGRRHHLVELSPGPAPQCARASSLCPEPDGAVGIFKGELDPGGSAADRLSVSCVPQSQRRACPNASVLSSHQLHPLSWDRLQLDPRSILRTKAIQPAERADPNVAFPVFHGAIRRVIGQPVSFGELLNRCVVRGEWGMQMARVWNTPDAVVPGHQPCAVVPVDQQHSR